MATVAPLRHHVFTYTSHIGQPCTMVAVDRPSKGHYEVTVTAVGGDQDRFDVDYGVCQSVATWEGVRLINFQREGVFVSDGDLSDRSHELSPMWTHGANVIVKPDLNPLPKEKTIMSIVDNLKAKIAADKAKLAIIESLGEDDFADGAVLLFTKTFPERDARYQRVDPVQYHYAAIKSPKGWHITGRESGTFSWEDLVEFVSEGVETVEVVTEVEAIA